MKSCSALFLLWAIPFLLFAQRVPGWEYTLKGVAEGLSDNNIFHIFKDSRGFVWISTQNGVNRWDGYEFNTYNYNPSDTNSLSGNWVNFSFEDRAGFLWFGTFGAGLCRFDPRRERFERFPKSERAGGLSSDVVTCAAQDAAGILWFGTANAGLVRFDPANQSFSSFPKAAKFSNEVSKAAFPTEQFSGPPSAHITSLLDDGEQGLWVGSAFGLSHFDKRSGMFEYFFHDPQNLRSLSDNFIISLHRSQAGDLWVRMPKAWVRFDAQHRDFQLEKQYPRIPKEASQRHFWEASTGEHWQARDNGFQYWYLSKNPFELGLGERYPAEIFGLKKIRALLEHAGYLWVASEEGLFRSPLGGDVARPRAVPHQVLPQSFHALLADGEALWAASKTNGLFRIEMPTGGIRHFPSAPDSLGPSSNSLFVMTQDAWGKIWLGGRNVFDRFDPKSGKFSAYIASIKASSSILSLFFDRQKRLWVGTLSEGLFVYSFDDFGQIKGVEQFRYDPKDLNSISNDIILAIWQDSKDILWFGTDGGLNRLPAEWQSGQTARFHRYLRSDGLADDKIMSIRDDSQGNLWVGHLSHGLSSLSSATGLVRTFGLADGLPSTLLYWTSAWKRPDGALLFGTTEGLVAFHPDSLKPKNMQAPPVFFTEIQLFNKKMEIGRGAAHLPESPVFSPNLIFDHDQNSLTFRFAALNFIHPELNRFAYRLEPLDEDWHPIGTRHEISFSHLQPGRYTLRVKACNNEGVWNETGATLPFRIRPPWWCTPWAFAVYALLLGGGLWLAFLHQVRASKRKFWLHFGQTLAETDLGKLPKGASGVELEFLQTLYKVLEKHFADEYFSVEQMARELALSRTQLHRKTIEVTGFSAGQLLQNLRLEHALQLLAESNLNIAEVSFRCGFSDPNYFSRLFSKTQGMTPTEFSQRERA